MDGSLAQDTHPSAAKLTRVVLANKALWRLSVSGARGGKDQFNWESVKSDKDREFYLGHSVKASVGRWQKGNSLADCYEGFVSKKLQRFFAASILCWYAGKDLFWYAKDKKDDAAAAVRNELAVVKAREEELMMEVEMSPWSYE